jgi:CHAT domain-containing protein
MNKAEAIRLAQKEMIDGRLKSSGKSTGCRSEDFISGPQETQFKCDPNAPFSHPYFWSPFVLIGNWR